MCGVIITTKRKVANIQNWGKISLVSVETPIIWQEFESGISTIIGSHQFPPLVDMTGWKDIQIWTVPEFEDPLIPINNYNPRVMVNPQYYRQRLRGASEILYARKSVVQRLSQAVEVLPDGLNLLVLDSYRPIETQQDLYGAQYSRLKSKHSEWDEPTLFIETQRYVSLPSILMNRPSPHLTGGAIDLTICDKTGTQLDMGTAFDYFGPEAATCYFARASEQKNQSINRFRLLLHYLMASAGFTNYQEEWWHYDYGNQFWAKTINRPYAIFGPVFQDREEVKE